MNEIHTAINDLQESLDSLKVKVQKIRPCYCWSEENPGRWERWRDGRRAGPDLVVGTADDVNLGDRPS